MVELQVPKQIPWAVEDIVSDYSIIEKDSSGYSRVLLAVCQKDVIKRHLNILSSCGLKAGGIALSSEGVCRWFRYFSHKNNIKEAKPVVLLDINAQATDICFYHKENLVFTRSVAFGLADLKNDKIGELVEELHKTFSSLQRDEIVSEIGKIIITADLDLVNNLAVKLNLDFGCEVVARNSLNEAALEKKLIVPLALSEGKCAATSILGFALDGSRRSFNLFPPEIKNQEEEKKKIKDLAFLGLALVLVLVFSAAALAGKIYKKEQYLKSLAAALKEDNPKAQKIEGLIKKLNLVKDRLNPQGTSIDMIRELYSLVPEGISLSIFSFDDAEFITLQGVSFNMSDVFNFQSILDKSPYFKNVEVKYASKRKVRQGELTDFRITCIVDREKIKRQ
jgi:Tfp pilus assembly protein, ATPase PilM